MQRTADYTSQLIAEQKALHAFVDKATELGFTATDHVATLVTGCITMDAFPSEDQDVELRIFRNCAWMLRVMTDSADDDYSGASLDCFMNLIRTNDII